MFSSGFLASMLHTILRPTLLILLWKKFDITPEPLEKKKLPPPCIHTLLEVIKSTPLTLPLTHRNVDIVRDPLCSNPDRRPLKTLFSLLQKKLWTSERKSIKFRPTPDPLFSPLCPHLLESKTMDHIHLNHTPETASILSSFFLISYFLLFLPFSFLFLTF